ncbi:MAG: hypothetical protein ACRC92_25930 [Peptostreptococcaceae bacterium]
MRTLCIDYKNYYNCDIGGEKSNELLIAVSDHMCTYESNREKYGMTKGEVLCQEVLDLVMEKLAGHDIIHSSNIITSVFDNDIYAMGNKSNLEFSLDTDLVVNEDYEDTSNEFVTLRTGNRSMVYIPIDLYFGETKAERSGNMNKYLNEIVGDMSQISPYDTTLSANGRYDLELKLSIYDESDKFSLEIHETKYERRKNIAVNSGITTYNSTNFRKLAEGETVSGTDICEDVSSFTLGYFNGTSYVDIHGNVIKRD